MCIIYINALIRVHLNIASTVHTGVLGVSGRYLSSEFDSDYKSCNIVTVIMIDYTQLGIKILISPRPL